MRDPARHAHNAAVPAMHRRQDPLKTLLLIQLRRLVCGCAPCKGQGHRISVRGLRALSEALGGHPQRARKRDGHSAPSLVT